MPLGWAECIESYHLPALFLVGLADQLCASVPVGPPYKSGSYFGPNPKRLPIDSDFIAAPFLRANCGVAFYRRFGTD